MAGFLPAVFVSARREVRLTGVTATINPMSASATIRFLPDHPARRLLVLLVAGVLFQAPGLGQEQPRPTEHTDQIDVTRVLVDARVLDVEGNPIPNLGVTNFRVRIGHKRAIVESVEWVSGNVGPGGDVERTSLQTGENPSGNDPFRVRDSGTEPASDAGKLIVFFFQRDLHPSRMVGLMKMVQRATEVLDTLDPADRIAIFCYDSHLRLYSDFTTDRSITRRILRESIITYGDPPEIAAGEFPSIAGTFDAHAAKNAPNPERALWVVGQSLRELPGPKSMFFFGWGLGRLVAGSFVQLRAEYSTALRALTDARVTVFSLDVTNADYHSLEGPLRTVAVDTGGFYVKTHLFSEVAMDRVARALGGHYVLTLRKPPKLGAGRHEMRVRLHKVNGTVHARRWVEP